MLYKRLSDRMDVSDQTPRVDILDITLCGFECGLAEEEKVCIMSTLKSNDAYPTFTLVKH